MQNKVGDFLVGIGMCLLGLFILFYGKDTSEEVKDFNANVVKTTAVVEKVQKEVLDQKYKKKRHRKRWYRYKNFLSYDVNGQRYSNVELITDRETFSEGQNVTIYYNQKNPTDIQLRLSDAGGEQSSINAIGLLFLIPGMILTYKKFKEIENN